MKNIKISLNDDSSISNAIKELKTYRTSLEDKIKALVDDLARNGVDVARTWVAVAQGNTNKPSVGYLVDSQGMICLATIYMEGEEALFVEFGAGIHYNASDPPHAATYGYGVGTYNPNSDNAFNPDGWWYFTGTAKVHSYGTEGTYPMYHAAENARNTCIQKAIEAFK